VSTLHIKAKTTFDAWIQGLRYIWSVQSTYVDHHKLTCKEVFGLTVEVESMESVSEPIAYLSKEESFMYPSLSEIADSMLNPQKHSAYDYSYGNRLFMPMNQIDDVIIARLKEQASSRRAIAIAYDVSIDSQASTHRELPSLISVSARIVGDTIQLHAVFRSTDFFFGWPANIYQLSVLSQYIAHKLSKKVGSITTHSISGHVFEDYAPYVTRLLKQSQIE
jgi:thymidylate synthase (methanogen type)